MNYTSKTNLIHVVTRNVVHLALLVVFFVEELNNDRPLMSFSRFAAHI